MGRLAFAGGSSCADLSRVNPNDLLALPDLGSNADRYSPSVKCTAKGSSNPVEEQCEKATIVHDEMLGRDRRLLITRLPAKGTPADTAYVFGCVAGQAKRLLTSDNLSGLVTIEHARRDEVVLRGSETPLPGNDVDRIDFVWDPRIHRYRDNEDKASLIPAPPKQMPCNQLKSAKANDLIILANGDFPVGDGSGGYPFTHGQGCYESDKVCDWYVEVDDDRMISADRRLISFDSDHRTGTGTWGYVYVVGCVAGQIRTIYGGDFLQGGGVVEPAAPQPSIEPTPAPTTQVLPGFWHVGVPKAGNATKHPSPVQLQARATPTPGAAPRAQHQKSPTGNADTLIVSGCAEYPCSVEVLYTYKWNAALNNYILASVRYGNEMQSR